MSSRRHRPEAAVLMMLLEVVEMYGSDAEEGGSILVRTYLVAAPGGSEGNGLRLQVPTVDVFLVFVGRRRRCWVVEWKREVILSALLAE